MSPSHSSGFHLLPKAVTRTGQVGKMKHEGRGSVVGPPSSHLLQLPSVITALLYYGICVEKKLQLATNKNQHNLSQWIILKPPLSNTPTLTHTQAFPHHMLVCSTTLFTFLLANYLPLSPVCLGAGRSKIGGISAIL